MSSSSWQRLLGRDVNNLLHLLESYSLSRKFLIRCAHPHEGWGKKVSYHACFEKYEQSLLLTTALLHDWAEAIIGDIPFVFKTEEDEQKELLALRKIVYELLDKDFPKDVLEEVIDTVHNTQSKIGKAFNAIEHAGYMKTAFRAWKKSFISKDKELQLRLQSLMADVIANSMAKLTTYAEIYPYIHELLTSEKATIAHFFQLESGMEFVYAPTNSFEERMQSSRRAWEKFAN